MVFRSRDFRTFLSVILMFCGLMLKLGCKLDALCVLFELKELLGVKLVERGGGGEPSFSTQNISRKASLARTK